MQPTLFFTPSTKIVFTSQLLGDHLLYITRENGKIIHLTFAIKRLLNIQKITGIAQITSQIAQEKSPQEIKKIIQAGTNRPFPEQSPFIRWATPFQREVWRQISLIPKGETRTYGQLATAIGRPKAARAVGRACNQNPLPLIIPCHRVVAKGGLGGYAGGQEIKNYLLGREQKTYLQGPK